MPFVRVMANHMLQYRLLLAGSVCMYADCRVHGIWIGRSRKTPMPCSDPFRTLPSKDTVAEWDDLTFQFGPRAFLYADKNRIVGFASTPG